MSELLNQLAEFHFLRPLWLLLLVLIPIIYRTYKSYRPESSSWAQAIDRRLIGFLLEQGAHSERRTPLYLLITSVLLTSLALAGPVWKKIPVPVHKAEDALVIIMDLSLSMQATDLKPSRLVKARHKLIDILDVRQQGQTALVAYAGDAHIVSPLTDDTETIKSMVPALSPLIMPAMGSRPDLAFQLALQMLDASLIKEGQILLITDGLRQQDSERIIDLLEHTEHTLSLLSIGTPEGAPIPIPNQGFLKQRGDIVIAKNDPAPLAKLVENLDARAIGLQIDDTDVNYLLAKNPLRKVNETREVEREFDQWREEGPWLLILLIPIVSLAFRRGWLLPALLLVVMQPAPSYAFDWKDLWQTGDQQGAEAFADGEHQKAATLFESGEWRASASYRAGDYKAAAEGFSALDNATGHYNRGNALAKAGKLEAALAAYEQALEMDPEHEDTQFNQALIKQLLEQNQQQNQQQPQDQNDENQSEQDSNNQQQDNQQNGAQDQSSETDSEQGQQGENQSPEPETSETDGQDGAKKAQKENEQEQQHQASKQDKEQTDQPATDTQQVQPAQDGIEQSEEAQAREQWLRRVPDDPSGLLKRKFDYQYRQRQLDNQFLPPKEDQPIW